MLYFANPKNKNKLYIQESNGGLKRIYRGIYIEANQDLNKIIKTNFLDIIGFLFWEASLSAATALSFSDNNKYFFVRSKYRRKCKIGNYFFVSSPYLKWDYDFAYRTFSNNISIPKKELALLETICIHKNNNKRLNWLEGYLIKNVNSLDFDLIDRLTDINPKKFWMAKERLFKLIGKIKGTQKATIEDEKNIRLLNKGLDIDIWRIEIFKELQKKLKDIVFISEESIPLLNNIVLENFCFFESYFSNYIEGSKLIIPEALKILKGEVLTTKPKDSYDFLSHYKFSSSLYPNVYSQKNIEHINTSDDFINFIKVIHYKLNHNSLKEAGIFKSMSNHVWWYVFVEPSKVEGTLRLAFEIWKGLSNYQKSLFFPFILSEIHPFIDWNGRLSRVVMNYFLIKSWLSPIVITNAFRDSYISALRDISSYNDCYSYIRKLQSITLHNKKYDFNIPKETNP